MQSILAFPVFLQRPEVIVHAPNTAAMDWFVIATLCFFFFLLGCFATAAWQIWRRATRPEPHIRLLMELSESTEDKIIQAAEEAPPDKSPTDPPTPWEKPPDWWKQ
ncbi:hypothetical protein SAMN02745166_00777 [Prosthecobacter debontii]|uniref:Uncharacterized protein n=1 Tax=Prosthecobacter debontii TaxID=48467 RepID=A0A1T4WW57_9BACT|nr:hypothetical protein [Prosthecobacter debontii]SKA81556.1 hypothetical protein SAMN02745166_00777 [Prosthecobacter debontii]